MTYKNASLTGVTEAIGVTGILECEISEKTYGAELLYKETKFKPYFVSAKSVTEKIVAALRVFSMSIASKLNK